MIHSIRQVSTFFFITLLGVFAANKLFLLMNVKNGATTFLNNATIVPMGIMSLLFISTTIKEELNRNNIHNILYDILLFLFSLLILILILFIRWFIATP